MSKYIYITLKKDLFGGFKIKRIRDKDIETGLKEEGGIEMSTIVLSIYAMHVLFRFCIYLPDPNDTTHKFDNYINCTMGCRHSVDH